MALFRPKIAIVGAGPAGCMLGRLLHNAGIKVTIFEGESSLDVRSQGGTLDLNSGLQAVKKAGLWDEYLQYSRFDGSAIGLCDKNATFFFKIGASKAGNPEIDRVELRRLLLRSLPDGAVKWSSRLLEVKDDLTLRFEDREETGFDLVVGAEGAWSKVRNALTDTKPFYTEIYGYSLDIPNAAEEAPSVAKFVNRGSLFSYSDHKFIGAQQIGDGSLNVSAWFNEGFYPKEEHLPTKDEIMEKFADWSPEMLDILQSTSGNISIRPLYQLPVGTKWEHKKFITLIGDAAHLVTPFGGEGVNVAFVDAMLLAEAIIDGVKANDENLLHENIVRFEEDMFNRAYKVEEMTDGMTKASKFDSEIQGLNDSLECHRCKSYGQKLTPPSFLRRRRQTIHHRPAMGIGESAL